jgi:hypothetical protein
MKNLPLVVKMFYAQNTTPDFFNDNPILSLEAAINFFLSYNHHEGPSAPFLGVDSAIMIEV